MINFQERICCQDSFWSQNVGAKLNGKSTYETPVGMLPCGVAAPQVGTPPVVVGWCSLGPDLFTKAIICPSSYCFLIPFSMCSPILFLGDCVFFFSFFFPPATLNPLIWSRKLCQEPSGCAGGISHTCPFPAVLCPCDWDVTGTCTTWGEDAAGAVLELDRAEGGPSTEQQRGGVLGLWFHHQELLLLLPSLA